MLVRFGMVAGVIGLLLAFALAGCASSSRQAAPPNQVEIVMHGGDQQDDADEPAPIRFVRKTPSRAQYRFVGEVRAVARDEGFVEAAARVRKLLAQKARALGADVVQINVVSPGDDEHLVVLAGRAYRSAR
jgi:hypothetical protein